MSLAMITVPAPQTCQPDHHWDSGVPWKLHPRRTGARECRVAGGPGRRRLLVLVQGLEARGPLSLDCPAERVLSAVCSWGAHVIFEKQEDRGQRGPSSTAGRDGACGRRTCASAGARAPPATCLGAAGGRGHRLWLPVVPVLSRVPDLAGRAPGPSCHPALPSLWKHLYEALSRCDTWSALCLFPDR